MPATQKGVKVQKMTPDDMQLIFEAGFQLVVSCYLIGFGIGIICKVLWQALEKQSGQDVG